MHRADGPAIVYPDGFSVCVFHGVRVPHDGVLRPDKVPWPHVEGVTDAELKNALADLKALRWGGGDEAGEDFRAALATKRLGGISALRDLVEGKEK